MLKRIAIGGILVLLAIAGYVWIQRVPAGPPSPAVAGDTTAIAPDTATADAPDRLAADSALTTTGPSRKSMPVTRLKNRSVESETVADRPVEAEEESGPDAAAEKPVPVVCDQVVMRNGDLTDAKILEVGVNEIRYRKCRREDGPEYVVSKSDVLSIRYANGDIDRF